MIIIYTRYHKIYIQYYSAAKLLLRVRAELNDFGVDTIRVVDLSAVTV